MINPTCPYPTNINPLYPGGFQLSITKLPELSFFCQTASVPTISIPNVSQSTPFSQVNLPGDKIEFSPLEINFLIDETMGNYLGIYEWLKGMGFPTSNNEYSNFLNSQDPRLSEAAKVYSDGTLAILGSNYNTIKSIRIVDLIPVRLDSLEFNSTITELNPLIGRAIFTYSYYEFI